MNGASTSELYLNAVTNNSFSLPNVEETIKETVKRSFGYLDNLQKHAIGLYRAHFTPNDLQTFDLKKQRVRLIVPKDLIDSTTRNRYRRSSLYQNEITLKDISDNQDIFIRLPLVFLNGMNTVKFTLKAYESNTEIYFEKTDELMKCDSITVIYLLNDGVINTVSNKYVFNEEGNKLPMKLFDSEIDFNTSGLTTITDMESMTGSSFNYATFEDNAVSIDLSSNASSIISNNRRVSVSVIVTRYMHTLENVITTFTDSSGNVSIRPFVIVDDGGNAFKMPIPVENIIISKYDADIGDFRIDDSITITRTYPFVYDIKDSNVKEGDLYQVIYFYFPMDGSYEYTNYLKYSYLLALRITGYDNIVDLVMALRAGEEEQFSYLLSFNPPDIEYDFPDYGINPKNPYHFDYKIDKMKDLIMDNPMVLCDYVINQSVANMFLEIDASKVDLSQRLRENTYSEAKLEYNKIEFAEPCYVFAIFLGNDLIYDKVFYIDGIFCDHLYSIKEYGIEYVYFPASKITPTSVIEVERLDGYHFESPILLENMSDSKHVHIKVPSRLHVRTCSKDVFFLDELTHEIPRENLRMTVTDGDTSYDVVPYGDAPVSELNVSIADAGYLGVWMKLVVDKTNSIYLTDVEKNNIFVTYVPEIFYIKRDMIRAYVDGRIICDTAVGVIYDEASDHYVLYILKPIKELSTIIVQVSPSTYKRRCLIETIPKDGMVDLATKLNKPFSSVYFDVFVNGRKLLDANIVQITPMKIKLVGLKSLKNLEIYEKDRSSNEYFGTAIDFSNKYDEIKPIEDRILDGTVFSPDEKQSLIDIILHDKYHTIEFAENVDEEEDAIGEYIDVESLPIAVFALDNIFERTQINPDERQLDSSVLEHGVNIDIAGWLDSDSEAESGETNVVTINPDVCADTSIAVQIISSDTEFTQKSLIDF